MKEKVTAKPMPVTGKRGSYRPDCGQLRFFKSLRGMPDYAEWILNSKLGLAADLRLIPSFDKIIRHIPGFGIVSAMPNAA